MGKEKKRKKLAEVKIPEGVQRLFTKFVFWIANKYPKEDESLLGKLRYLATSEPEVARKLSKHYESNTQLTLLGFRMTEIYTEDEIPKLLTTIQKRFGKGLRDPSFVERITTDWPTTGYTRIGSMSRASFGPRGNLSETIKVKRLREEIERVDISFYKFLPSMVGLGYDIYLTKEAQEKHKSLLQDKSLGEEILLKSYYPSIQFFSFSGISGIPASFRKASSWVDSILSDTTHLIVDLFGGLLSSKNSGGTEKLPAIEVYVANPEITHERKWLEENRGFLYEFGIDTFNIFRGPGILFCWGDKNFRSNVIENHKIILSPRLFFKKAKHVSKNQITPEYTHLYLWSNLSDWFPFLGSIYLINHLRSSMNWFRKEISKTANKIPGFGIQLQVKVLARFQKSHYLFRQFEKESGTFLTEKRATFSAESDLSYLNILKLKKAKRSIYAHFASVINWQREIMLPHFSILETFYSDYVRLINSNVTNRLSQIAIFIALFTLIVSFISGNSPFWRALFSIIEKLFKN